MHDPGMSPDWTAAHDPFACCRCPDCNSEVGLSVIAPGVLRLTVRHDSTCPTARGLVGGRP